MRALFPWLLLGAASSAIATLMKGPVGFLVPGLVLMAFHLTERRPKALWRLLAPVNLVLFWYFHRTADAPPVGFLLAYLAVALTGSVGTALYLAYHRDKLRA